MRGDRVLIISKEYPNTLSGIGDYTYYLANALIKHGCEICVLTSINKNLKNGNEIKVYPIVKKWNLFYIVTIIKQISKIKPDFINLQYVPYGYNHYGMPIYLPLLIFCLKISNFKVIVTFHEFAIRIDWDKPKYWIVGIAQRLIGYTIAFLSDKIIVTLEYNKRKLKIFSYKMQLIPIGSNIIPVEISEYEKKDLRKKIAPNNEFIISTFGTLQLNRSEYKILPIIKRYINKGLNPSIKLLFIGGIKDKPKRIIEKLSRGLEIEESIYFTGYLNNNEEIYKHLVISDAFIFLDVDKKGRGGINTKSGCVAAAYAAGLPIIGYKGDLTDDWFFKHMDNAFLINSLNASVLFDAVKLLTGNALFRKALEEKTIRTYKTQLNWSTIADKYTSILNSGI